MTTDTVPTPDTRAFEADVSKLLHMMVHSVYSDRDVFLRELISNAADACEKLRYEAISNPALLGDDPQPRISLMLDREAATLVIEDNGIGMTAADMGETLGTIARSGTKAFMDRIAADKNGEMQPHGPPTGWVRTRSHRPILQQRPSAERASRFTFSTMPKPMPSATLSSGSSRRSRAMSRSPSSSRKSEAKMSPGKWRTGWRYGPRRSPTSARKITPISTAA
jgi:hypothetical protein